MNAKVKIISLWHLFFTHKNHFILYLNKNILS